ncbi:MAG: YdhR family protein [Proteobacteria bacterium]|jgi:heme-degrading monooxygenase HmoA|nr:YdhR family protein [Pseudomonadota bacterium]HJP07670.1 YdhR family protein [Arenicellales bacterium]|tara:strand:- start:3231 stop:3533 length:303 start_codon:yes stop_codon:yes gene_type:complete
MHIQIINFNLEGISRAEYEVVCDDLAGTFAEVPGLKSKHWLADEENNTYGGVYIWETKEAYEAFVASELFAGVGANPALANITSKDFGVIEGPTRVTRGM